MAVVTEFIARLCRIGLIVTVPTMTFIIFLQVCLRYIFQSSLGWLEELSRYLLILITCLGSTYAVKQNLHISIVFIKNKFKGHLRWIITLLNHVLIMIFFAVCIKEGFEYALSQWHQSSTSLKIPMFFPMLPIPIGFLMMLIIEIENFILEIRKIFSR